MYSKFKSLGFLSLFILMAFYSLQDLQLIYPDYFPKPVYDFKKNPLKQSTVDLGRKLFYDPILSRDHTISCSSCHLSDQAFSHAGNHLSKGIEDGIGDRNSPAIFNLAWQKTFMWDGSVVNIDVQALAPINHPKEMGEDINVVVRKLNQSKEYKTLFYKSFGDSLATSERVMKALSQFQLTIVSANSKYDKVKQGKAKFTASENKGYQLFKGNCSSCHSEPLFSTYEFANNGLSYNSELKDYGKWNKTFEPADKMMFKIPSLRNLAYTYPYMHDGRFKTLNEVLEHYENGIFKSPTLAKQLEKPIIFNSQEKEDLLAFLGTLNDSMLVSNVEFQKK
ncbi:MULTISPECIES: cytochrome-c peroxidase [Chryseobacterium]|uniref:cytochrome-c peroxidase n=1 Tax=Chryseobacterium TaxID=59732 RepID=UPI000FB68007|nr:MULTISPECIES: cytochrome c peroxidase [Chryseobacterium]MBM7420823.1 cytochrome c peroxidase [Chryseobacterium sp. JUb44]MDH6210777.1 cytochrome c peroxidase [Chryseobacterium sp. BIGb0186]WSO09455.1 cytochrome c peroxidase [Chryseobacterium scophthalmum]